jgi:hypothetical protein
MGKTAKKPVPQAPAVPTTLGGLILHLKDPSGDILEGNVSVQIPKLEETRQKTTDGNGTAKFPDIPAGVVNVTVEPAPGFGPVPSGNQPFKPGPRKASVTIEEGPGFTVENVLFTKPIGFLKVLVRDAALKNLAKVPVEISPNPISGFNKIVTSPEGIADFGPVNPGPFHIKAGTSDVAQKPLFGPFQAPPDPAVIGLKETDKIMSIAEVATVPMQLEEKRLEIVKIDDHFAPSKETLDIRFAIKGLAGRKVVLTIEGDNYPGKKLVERDLGAGETADGLNNLIAFTGKIEVGASKDKFATPLMGPFKVRLFHEAVLADKTTKTDVLKSEKKFKILYHSLELKQGPFTPDEAEPDKVAKESDWVQFKLNQLGYYGGPVGKDTEKYLEKATIRYKANHKKMYEQFAVNYKKDIDTKLKDALTAGDNSRPFLVGDPFAGPGHTGKVMVEEIYYQYTGTTATTTEFGTSGAKSTSDTNRLNRPLIPLEATIFIKAKDNSKQLLPDLVGPLRVNFRMKDPNEDLSKQLSPTASEPSPTKKYLEAALVLNGGRSGDNGDNCPATLNGIRKTAPGTSFDAPFLLGDFYKPYTTASDAGQKVVFSTASVDAAFPKRLGKAGIFFRPSYIAGDDYQLTAEIDFTGQPNQAALEADHGATTVAKRLHVDTGTFVVTRFAKIAVSVDWPARTKNAPQFDLIKAEYARAHVELDVSSIVSRSITAVLTNAEYTAVINGISTIAAPAGLALRGTSYYGAPPPAQGNLNAAAYKALLSATCIKGYFERSDSQMGTQIAKKLRGEFPIGMILVTLNQHDPIDVKNDPAHGNNTVAPANAKFIAGFSSVGLADGVLLVDMQDPDKVYYVVAHELGHHFFLLHHENANDSPRPRDHDTNDHNCLMSYSQSPPSTPAFQAQKIFSPHFCGKCNLALRGWDHSNALLPAHS